MAEMKPSQNLSRRRAMTMISLTSAGLLLAGCGFRPLYGRRGSNAAGIDMAAIEINYVSDRLGQNLRNDLIERLTPFGEPARPRYVLAIQTSQSTSALAIQSNSTITRYNMLVNATFRLSDKVSGALLYSGDARAVGSYDAVQSDFATLTAEKDSARRTVREVAEDIRAQLGAFFARRRAAGQ